MLKLGDFVHYKAKPALELLGVCLAFANKHQMFQGGFDDNFSGYPENWLSASRRWGVENNENGWEFTKCPRSTIESTSNQGQCLKSLEISKEAFYVFRRIKSENSWKWNKFKIVMYLPLSKHFPATWTLPQNTFSLSFRISRIYLVTKTTFSGILVSLSHSSQLQRMLFTISR